MTSIAPDYNPTPLEYAYTSYLLETVFDLDASAAEIKISGREAVTFLSKSGVHRLILRNLWTTVDPNNTGSLLHRHQVSTLLRCIALAQHPKNDSMLDQALRGAYHEQKIPVVAIRECLVATSGKKDVPLARFDGIPLPSRATLQPYMNEGTEEDDDETETDDFGDFSAAPVPSAPVAVPLPPTNQTMLPPTQQQQPGFGSFGTVSSIHRNGGANITPQSQSTGMSPAGGLMPTQHQASTSSMGELGFPPMQQQPLSNNTQSWGSFDSMAQDPHKTSIRHQQQDEFGGFAATSTSSTSMQHPTPSGWNALDALTSPVSEPPPMVTETPLTRDQQSNGFGEISSSGQPPLGQFSGWNAPTGLTTNPTPIHLSLNQPNSTTLSNSQNSTDATQTMNGNFGGVTSSASEPSGWDALDALAASTPSLPPPTLPSVGISSEILDESSGQAVTPNDDGSDDDDDDDDDFGDFAAAQVDQQPLQQQEQQHTPGEWGAIDTLNSPTVPTRMPAGGPTGTHQMPREVNNPGALAPLQPQMQQPTVSLSQEPSGWDALDALATSPPVSPPILPERSVTTDQGIVDTAEQSQTKGDGDDFGDFISTPLSQQVEVTPDIMGGADDNDFGDFTSPQGSGIIPITENGVGANITEWGTLDSHAPGVVMSRNPHQQQPDELTAATSGVDDTTAASSPVNLLDSMTESPPQTENDLMPSATSKPDPIAPSGWDALDALATPPAPPPPLGTQQLGQSEIAQTDKDTEDFGDFGSRTVYPKQGSDVNGDDFGDFEATSAALSTSESHSSSAWGTLGASGVSVPNDGKVMAIQLIDAPTKNHSASQDDSLNVPRPVGLSLERAVSLSPPPEDRSGIPNIPSRKTIKVTRSDTAFYSAKMSSFGAQSEVSSLGDFADAVQNPEDLVSSEQTGMNGGKSVQTKGGPSPHEINPDDPFAAFQSLAPEQPARPLPPLSSFESKDLSLDRSAENYKIIKEQTQQGIQRSMTYEDEKMGTNTPESMLPGQSNLFEDDDFGAFSGVDASLDSKPETLFDASEQLEGTDTNTFGDYGEAQLNKASGTVAKRRDNPNTFGSPNPTVDAGDDFGDFSAPTSTLTGVEGTDDFGDFSNFNAAESVSNDTTGQPEADVQSVDRSFDGFSDFDAVPTHNALSDDSGDEWDAFQEASQPSTPKRNDPETENLLKIRQLILSAVAHVPESLLQCLGANGGHVDFANCFEANIGVEIPISSERKKRMQRCLQIATLLSSDRSKLASAYWTAAISTAKDELSLGFSLCIEAKNLTKKERLAVLPSLYTYIRGLSEILRVIRMIVATIGDLLMLDATSLFTVDTVASSWCSLAILKEVLEIEDLWKSISDEFSKISMEDKVAKKLNIASISDLRELSSVTTASPNQLCQFTLQPISEGCETVVAVQWGNRCFMACAANFLANRCSFFSYDD